METDRSSSPDDVDLFLYSLQPRRDLPPDAEITYDYRTAPSYVSKPQLLVGSCGSADGGGRSVGTNVRLVTDIAPPLSLSTKNDQPVNLKTDDGASVSSSTIGGRGGGTECTWTNNTDYWGNIDDPHIALRANVTRQQCCSLCKHHPNCSFAVFGIPSEHPPSACSG